MATDTERAPDRAVRQMPNPAATGNGHAPHPEHFLPEQGELSGTITATVAQPSVGDAGLPHDTLRQMYEVMALARALDERAWQVNRAGRAPFVVSGQGHEGAQVGAAFALDRERDILLPYYRDLALCVAWGQTATETMFNLMAKAGDIHSGARQMPNHFGSARLRIITGSSPVATQIPHATGTAYAAKVRRTGQVSFCSFGEGASSKGDFHEALNFAGIHKLPVVFFCENNRYAISVPQDLQMPIAHVADRAAAYGFPGVIVDGTDTLAVYQVVKEAAERARRGDGPTLVEAKVYRFTPHSSDDDDRTYRSQDEVKAWRARDPLGLFEARLREVGALDDASLAAIKERIKRDIHQATEAAEQAPFPNPATFDQYVYGG